MTTSPPASSRAVDLSGQLEPRGTGPVRDFGVPESVGSLVGPQCSNVVALFLKQDPEVERAVGVTKLIRPPIGGLSGCPIAMLFEHHPQV